MCILSLVFYHIFFFFKVIYLQYNSKIVKFKILTFKNANDLSKNKNIVKIKEKTQIMSLHLSLIIIIIINAPINSNS